MGSSFVIFFIFLTTGYPILPKVLLYMSNKCTKSLTLNKKGKKVKKLIQSHADLFPIGCKRARFDGEDIDLLKWTRRMSPTGEIFLQIAES